MELFLNRPVDSIHPPWSEALLQAYVVQHSRRAGYLVAGDMNAGKRNPGMAQANGILAGAPDLRFFRPMGRLLQIELKTDRGRLSNDQKDLHKQLTALGFEVHTVYADCPASAWRQVRAILDEL